MRLAIFVIIQCLLEVGEVSVLVRSGDSAHAFHLAQLGVFYGELDGEERCDVFRLIGGIRRIAKVKRGDGTYEI